MSARPQTANIHAVVPRSRANGPGDRTVIWFQGCTLGCAGCFNPQTHAPADRAIEIGPLVIAIAQRFAAGLIEGVTISGGEPFQQPGALAALVTGIRGIVIDGRTPSLLAFSGYTLDELRAMPGAQDILSQLDVLIDGRYQAPQRLGSTLRGSTNQQVRLLSARYTAADVAATPELEIQIAADGSLAITGVAPLALSHLTRRKP